MKTITTFLIFLSSMFIFVHAQTKDLNELIELLPKEHVELLTNSEWLISGQVLSYSLSCATEQNVETVSDIAYIELVSDKKETIFKHKITLNKAKGYGDFFIPASLKTGHYIIIAYTLWSLNNTQKPYDQKDLYIINPYLNAAENRLKTSFSENDNYVEISAISNVNPHTNNGSDGLKISTDSKNYKHRAKVNIEIMNTKVNSKGSYILKVQKVEPVKVHVHNRFQPKALSSSKIDHLPEMRGELIRGIVTNSKTKLPTPKQYVSLSMPGESFIYKATRTNDDGEFYFNLFEDHDLKTSFFQVISENRNDFEITIDQSGFDHYNDLNFYSLKLNSNLGDFITKNSIYNQVESAYYNLKDDSLRVSLPSKSFYGAPDIVYDLDTYTRFRTMKETFTEVVRGAAMRTDADGFKLRVYDPEFPFQSRYKDVKPLLILDGIQIQDETFFARFNPLEIKTVSLTKGIYSIGAMIYNGIIDVKLIKPNSLNISGLAIEQIEIQTPLAKKEYFQQEHNESDDRIPDFRTQLLWLPEVMVDSELKTIGFYTSDISGTYLIELIGKNTIGESVHLTSFFEVTE